MDKFFTVLKENGLIMNFVFSAFAFDYRRRTCTSDEVKKHPAF